MTVSNQTDVQDVIRCCKTEANVGDNNTVRLCVRVDDSVTPRDNKYDRSYHTTRTSNIYHNITVDFT